MGNLYISEYMINGVCHETTTDAADMSDASAIIKALHPDATYISIGNARVYYSEIKRTTSDAVRDFIDFMDTYIDGVYERDATTETIGEFIRHGYGFKNGYMPALWIEDEDGNMIEYFIYTDPLTVRHDYY